MSPQFDHTQQAHNGPAQRYVVEHYGFETPSAATADDRPPATRPLPPERSPGWRGRVAGIRGKKLLVAGALGLVLTGGVGGYAAAMDGAGVHGRGDGDRRASPVEERNGDIPRGSFGGRAGPR